MRARVISDVLLPRYMKFIYLLGFTASMTNIYLAGRNEDVHSALGWFSAAILFLSKML